MVRLAAFIAILALPLLLLARRSFRRVRRGFPEGLQDQIGDASPRRWIIGGMIGAGKTTFARSLARGIGVTHIEIDVYASDAAILEDICLASGGWVAEANPWQIPTALAGKADAIVFIDYDNVVNYVRLLRRGYREWASDGFSFTAFKRHLIDITVLDLGRIVFRYGHKNRKGWRDAGMLSGIDPDATIYIRCVSPAELRLVLDVAAQKLGT